MLLEEGGDFEGGNNNRKSNAIASDELEMTMIESDEDQVLAKTADEGRTDHENGEEVPV